MAGESDAVDANTQVSHEVDGRVLSGVGVTAEALAETMERHAPESKEPAAGAGTVPASGGESATPAPDKPLSRGAQRFSDLTKERDEAKTAREAAERERDELKARITQPPVREPERATPAPAAKPAAEKFPSFETWLEKHPDESFDDFLDARTAHTYAALRETERREDAARSEDKRQQDVLRKYAADVTAIKAELPDYDAVLAGVGERDVSLVVAQAVNELGPRTAYYIAQHLDTLRELTNDTLVLPDQPGFAAAVASTRRYLASLTAAPKAAPKAGAYTPPPSPMTPVNTGGRTATPTSADLADKAASGGAIDFDSSGYREQRARERGVKSRY